MFKVFLSFCLLFSATVILAAQPKVLPLQERFDKLAAQKTFGDEDISEFRALMAAEKESGEKIDCTLCPDAFTWKLVENGFLDEAGFLFDRNADYGIKDKNGMTLLHLACRGGHKDFAEYLIKLGAEVDLPDDEGRTAIHYAVMSGNSTLVQTLLDLGSDPNKLTKKKETPLHFAAKYSGLLEVQFLINHGASVKAINWTLVENLKEQRRRQDKLYYDSDEKHISDLKAALGLKTPESLGNKDDDDEDDDGYGYYDEDDDGGERYADTMSGSDSYEEKESGKPQRIDDLDKIPIFLLPRDVNDAATTDGLTALHFAAENGDTDVVKFLVDHGADVKAQDTVLSRSAIHFAAENGNLECIKYLTEKGADLQDKDSFGATALHYAAKSNHLDIVKYLVGKKMDYTAKDKRGWSAMHYAASGGSIDVVKYLLAKGLNINELNENGRTPLFFARQHRELRSFMISRGAK